MARTFLGVVCLFAVLRGASSAQNSFEESLRKGSDAMRSGNLEEAERDFSDAANANPVFAGAFLNLGLVRVQRGEFEQAIAPLKKAISLKPAIRGAHLFLGISNYRLSNFDQATAALTRENELDPSNAKVLMWLGIAQLGKGDAAAAAKSLDKAAALAPSDVDILYHRGRAHMLVSKDSYEAMYKAEPNSWRIHQVLSQSYAEADRLKDAIAECQLALSARPDEPGLHEELGDLYWQLNQLPNAEAEFEAEVNTAPENTGAMYKLAVISLERSKTEVAAGLLSNVLKRQPHSADAEYQLGRVQAQMGDLDTAIINFKAAVVDSKNVDNETLRQSYYQLAQLYRRRQQPEESRSALEAFLRLKDQADKQQAQNLQEKVKRSAQLQEAEPSQSQ